MVKASERARDQKRKQGGPRYAGQQWRVADKRGAGERFGIARSDSADHAPDLADTRIEGSAERAGFHGKTKGRVAGRGGGR